MSSKSISHITLIEGGTTINSKVKIINPSHIEIECSVKEKGLPVEGNCILKIESSQILSVNSNRTISITLEEG